MCWVSQSQSLLPEQISSTLRNYWHKLTLGCVESSFEVCWAEEWDRCLFESLHYAQGNEAPKSMMLEYPDDAKSNPVVNDAKSTSRTSFKRTTDAKSKSSTGRNDAKSKSSTGRNDAKSNFVWEGERKDALLMTALMLVEDMVVGESQCVPNRRTIGDGRRWAQGTSWRRK